LLLLEYLQGPQVDQKYSRWDSIFFPSLMPEFLETLRLPDSDQPFVARRENLFPFRREERERLHTYRFFNRNLWGLGAYFVFSAVLLYYLCIGVSRKNHKRAAKQGKETNGASLKVFPKTLRIWAKIIYFVVAIACSLVLGILSGILWVANTMKSFDVVIGNSLALLGSPFLIVQLIALFLLIFPALRWRAWRFILWNWRLHVYLALFLPIGTWLYSLILRQSMQNILLPWFAVFPILLALSAVAFCLIEQDSMREKLPEKIM
ncbi:MAG: hypothetical protein AAF975_04430, partial [Spirochaetota bacterium]